MLLQFGFKTPAISTSHVTFRYSQAHWHRWICSAKQNWPSCLKGLIRQHYDSDKSHKVKYFIHKHSFFQYSLQSQADKFVNVSVIAIKTKNVWFNFLLSFSNITLTLKFYQWSDHKKFERLHLINVSLKCQWQAWLVNQQVQTNYASLLSSDRS